MIKDLIYRAKDILLYKAIFNSELKNIKQTFINNHNEYPNYIADQQIKRAIENINSNCNGYNTTSNKPKNYKLLFRNQMHRHYKHDEIAQKI